MDNRLASILESLLFASGHPMGITQLAEICEEEPKTVRMTLLELSAQYAADGRGIELVRFDDKFQMMSAGVNSAYVKTLLDSRRNPTLSQAALEVLSVTAYNQPVTRAYIEQIRGVDCSAVIHSLVEKELIEEKGRLDAPGRPLLYGTTVNFLRVFNITSLSDLPELSELKDPTEEAGEAEASGDEAADAAEVSAETEASAATDEGEPVTEATQAAAAE